MFKKKYAALMKISMQDSIAYRFSYFTNILASFIAVLTTFYVWRGIFAGREELNGYTWSEMKTYLFVMFMINTLISWYSEGKISKKILDGSVAMDLLKPIDFQKTQLVQTIGASITEGCIALVFSGIFILQFGGIILPSHGITPVLFLVSVTASFFVKFNVVYLFGLLCFWTTNGLGIRWARGAITNLLSGALIPITFFPGWLLATAKVLPFQCIVFIPASIFTETAGSTTQVLLLIALQIFWSVALWLFGKMMWKWAIQKVTIQGG